MYRRFLYACMICVAASTAFAADVQFKYTGVFKRTIYDQSTIVDQLNGNQEHDQPIIERELLRRKKEAVVQYVDKILRPRSEWYNEQTDDLVRTLGDRAAESSERAMYQRRANTWGTIYRWSVGHDETNVPAQKKADALMQSVVSGLVANGQKLSQYEFFKKFMTKNECLKEEYLWDKEVTYLLLKRFMQPAVQKLIEEILIYARENGFSEGMREKIDFLTGIPCHMKANFSDLRPDLGNISEKLMALEAAFKAHPGLISLTGEMKEALWVHVVRDLALTTLPRVTTAPKRYCFYFQGPPGTGKSYTAREVAKFLGWPSSSPVLLAESDFSRSTLYGTASDPGIILSTYGNVDEDKKYINAVLILDDFDRLLVGSNAAHGTAALSFLQAFLDRNLDKIDCPYLDGQFDISRLSIIITGNSDLAAVCRERGGEYEAIMSRLRIVDFGRSERDTVYRALEPKITSILADYNIAGEEHELKQLVRRYILDKGCPTDLREVLDKHVMGIVNAYMQNPDRAKQLYDPRLRQQAHTAHERRPVVYAGAGGNAGAGAQEGMRHAEQASHVRRVKSPDEIRIKLDSSYILVAVFAVVVFKVFQWAMS